MIPRRILGILAVILIALIALTVLSAGVVRADEYRRPIRAKRP